MIRIEAKFMTISFVGLEPRCGVGPFYPRPADSMVSVCWQ
jgi:hypothetical protein